jgi:hypothetical protein
MVLLSSDRQIPEYQRAQNLTATTSLNILQFRIRYHTAVRHNIVCANGKIIISQINKCKYADLCTYHLHSHFKEFTLCLD